MSKPILHFAHANGFPASCYRKLFQFLETDFELNYLDMHGHNEDYPVSDNWDFLADELIATIERSANDSVYGVGHSLGGVLTFIAAVKKPELFRGIVLLDSPILGSFRSRMLLLAKRLNFIDHVTPGRRTKARRIFWQDEKAAMAYFAEKPLFQKFDLECLSDYIKYGTEKREDGLHLRFKRHIEYQIYRTIPHSLPQFKSQLSVPAALIYGKDSNVCQVADLKHMQKYYNISSEAFEGGHLFPFEKPKATAEAIKKIISSF